MEVEMENKNAGKRQPEVDENNDSNITPQPQITRVSEQIPLSLTFTSMETFYSPSEIMSPADDDVLVVDANKDTEFRQMKKKFLRTLIPIAAIVLVFSFWSIISTRWAKTDCKNHPNGVDNIFFGPLSWCVKNDGNYVCGINFVDTSASPMSFIFMRTTTLLTFVFSLLVFFSLWNSRGFGKYRFYLSTLNWIFGLLTVFCWFMVGGPNADWQEKRDYVWATYGNNGSKQFYNFGDRGLWIFAICNILFPVIHGVIFNFLSESDFEEMWQYHVEYSKMAHTQYSRTMNEEQQSYSSTEYSRYLTERNEHFQERVKTKYEEKKKNSQVCGGFVFFIVFFFCVLAGVSSSLWSKDYVYLDMADAQDVAFQKSLTAYGFSGAALTSDPETLLGGASAVSYGPFTTCLHWSVNRSASKYQFCSGAIQGKKDSVADHGTMRALVTATTALVTLVTLALITPLVMYYRLVTAYITVWTPCFFFWLTIASVAFWADHDAGNTYLPQDMNGIWSGELHRGFYTFLFSVILFMTSTWSWGSCCPAVDIAHKPFDTRPACFRVFQLCQSMNEHFMGTELYTEMEDKYNAYSTNNDKYEYNPVIKYLSRFIFLCAALLTVPLFADWHRAEVKGGPNDLDLQIETSLWGRYCNLDNKNDFEYCGNINAFYGSRTRFTRTQAYQAIFVLSSLFAIWHFYEYLRRSKGPFRRTKWGYISFVCAVIALSIYVGGAGECDYNQNSALAAYSGSSPMDYALLGGIVLTYDCDASYVTGLKGFDGKVDSTLRWWFYVFVVGLVLYFFALLIETYIMFNPDAYYVEVDAVKRAETKITVSSPKEKKESKEAVPKAHDEPLKTPSDIQSQDTYYEDDYTQSSYVNA